MREIDFFLSKNISMKMIIRDVRDVITKKKKKQSELWIMISVKKLNDFNQVFLPISLWIN